MFVVLAESICFHESLFSNRPNGRITNTTILNTEIKYDIVISEP